MLLLCSSDTAIFLLAYPEIICDGIPFFFALIKDKKCGKMSTAGIEIQSWSTLLMYTKLSLYTKYVHHT